MKFRSQRIVSIFFFKHTFYLIKCITCPSLNILIKISNGVNFSTAVKQCVSSVRIVGIIKEIEPNLDLSENDDIDFNQVSDNTLAIRSESLSSSNQSSRELAILQVKAVAPKSIVSVMQRTCSTFAIDELIKRFNSYLYVNIPLPASTAIALGPTVPVMQRTCPTFAINAIEKTVKIEMSHVPGQPKITYIFTEQMWQSLCFALSLFLPTTTNNIASASSIVEIGSDEEEEEVEQGVYDGYVADDDDDDEEGNCPSPNEADSINSTENASDDSDFGQMSPTALNAALFALYHKNRQ